MLSKFLDNIDHIIKLFFNIIQVHIFKWFKLHKQPKLLPGTIIEAWICSFCEAVSIQGQHCQILSKFLDNMDYIIIINVFQIMQGQFFQVLAAVCNKADCFRT